MFRATLLDLFSRRRAFGANPHANVNFSAKFLSRRQGGPMTHERLHEQTVGAKIAHQAKMANLQRDNNLYNHEKSLRRKAAMLSGNSGKSRSEGDLAASRALISMSLAASKERKTSKLRHFQEARALKKEYRSGW